MSKVKSLLSYKGQKISESQKIHILKKLFKIHIFRNLNQNGEIEEIGFENHSRDYEVLGFVGPLSNRIPTRVRCLLCMIESNGHDCRIYKTTKGIITHVIGYEGHRKNFSNFPTIQLALQLVQAHSLSLQLQILEPRL